MVQYTLALKLKDSRDNTEGYKYSLDLNQNQENNPETIFTSNVKENVRQDLQNQSSSKISDRHLNQIIQAWILDISEGYRLTTITMDLPSLLAANLENIKESGNQELPALIKPDLSGIEPSFGMLPPLIFS